jgi:hypothetical protein
LSTIMEFRENFEREIPETSPAEFFVAIIGWNACFIVHFEKWRSQKILSKKSSSRPMFIGVSAHSDANNYLVGRNWPPYSLYIYLLYYTLKTE